MYVRDVHTMQLVCGFFFLVSLKWPIQPAAGSLGSSAARRAVAGLLRCQLYATGTVMEARI